MKEGHGWKKIMSLLIVAEAEHTSHGQLVSTVH